MELQSNTFFRNLTAGQAKITLPAEKQGFNNTNPFFYPVIGTDTAFTIESQSVQNYFNEMKKALGKKSETNLSTEDFEKYRQILANTEEFLEDTIKFSERASSSSEIFKQQKQFLEERLNLTNAIAGFFAEGKKMTTLSISSDKEQSESKDKIKSKKPGILNGIEIPLLKGLF